MEDTLYHYGIRGMKWGQRRYQNPDGSLKPAGKKRYRSTSLQAAFAKRSNDKVDAGFKRWDENAKKRDNAIDLGKQRNASKLAYEHDKSRENRKQMRSDNRAYKKALRGNTTYRKGTVRQEVGRDEARKYLSEAKHVKKQLASDPHNRELNRKYADLMSKHDIARAKARRAQEVGMKRSRKIASMKRAATISIKTAAASAAVGIGIAAAKRYMGKTDIKINADEVLRYAKKARKIMSMIY